MPLDSLSLRGPTSSSVTSTRSMFGSPFLLKVLEASTSSANSMCALSDEVCGLSLALDEEKIAIARDVRSLGFLAMRVCLFVSDDEGQRQFKKDDMRSIYRQFRLALPCGMLSILPQSWSSPQHHGPVAGGNRKCCVERKHCWGGDRQLHSKSHSLLGPTVNSWQKTWARESIAENPEMINRRGYWISLLFCMRG
jgi:hypothetical protein